MATADHLSNSSTLNPTAASFTMPTQGSIAVTDTSATPSTQPTMNGNTKLQRRKSGQGQDVLLSAPMSATREDSGEQKLSGAELKKKKAAEKAARRKEKVADRTDKDEVGSTPQGKPQAVQRRPSVNKKEAANIATPQHKRTGSSSVKALPLRGPQTAPPLETEKMMKGDKKVALFSHLYTRERRSSIAGASKEIHPAVLALGLQLRDHVICGGNARCIATLLVFKKVIQSYTTPPGMALSRHLTTHLSHQISYLSHSRPLSVSQGNAIRWLKKLISALEVDLSDNAAISFLCNSIDTFIQEKFTLADELITRQASARIVDGDVLLTYAKSSVVEKTLLSAHRQGKKFKVIVTDSRPLFEGKNLARSLVAAGIETQYCLISGLATVIGQITKCFLGASAMMGNGRLYSRAGTAIVAMMVKEGNGYRGSLSIDSGGRAYSGNPGTGKPVIVLCETVKFTGRVALDSVVGNELGDVDALVEVPETEILTYVNPVADTTAGKSGKKGGKGVAEDGDGTEGMKQKKGMEAWAEQPNLQLLNLMYDATPAEYLDMVITELGTLPPSAVPVVSGILGEED